MTDKMSDPLQKFGWKHSNYEHPSHDWICGRICEGKPCDAGPIRNGQCGQLVRVSKEKPDSDGKSISTSQPCKPKRSLRYVRRLITISFVSLCLASCLFLWSGTPSDAISPGPLSETHHSSGLTCSSCHVAAEGDWTHFITVGKLSELDANRCLNCHEDLGDNALLAHSLSVSERNELTQNVIGRQQIDQHQNVAWTTLLASKWIDDSGSDELSCGSCHSEHHGRSHDLKQLSDSRCQTCHAQQFHSFEIGHPEFLDYGLSKNGVIDFNHTTHMERYFLEDSARLMPGATPPKSCCDCHVRDEHGEKMRTLGFEVMCKECHGRNIADRDYPGIPFVSLPKESGSKSHFNESYGELPSFMKMLFASGNSLEEVESPDEDSTLVDTIREFLDDVSTDGQNAIDQHLGDKFAAFGAFEPSIVPSLIEAKHAWFLQGDHEVNQSASVNSNSLKRQLPPVSEFGGGWYLDYQDQSVRYRPLGHADPLVKNWLEQLVKQSTPKKQRPDSDAILKLTTLLENPTASGNEPFIGPVSSGRCLSCHIVSTDSNGEPAIDWTADSESRKRSLTKFSHAPHLITSKETSCLDCHELYHQAKPSLHLMGQDVVSLWNDREDVQRQCSSGFAAIAKSTCVACHNTATQSQQCGKCHNYHVRDSEILLQADRFRAAKWIEE